MQEFEFIRKNGKNIFFVAHRQRNPHKPSVYAGFYTYIAVAKKYASSILGSKSRCKLHILLPNGISAFLNCQKMRGRQKADSAKAKLLYFLP